MLHSNLTHLTFGNNFNQQVILYENITKLTIGEKFDQIIDFPSSITHLTLKCNNQSLIDNLPHGIINLELGIHFNLTLNDLPSSIETIKFNNHCYNKELNNLPKNLEFLKLPSHYNQQILNIPTRLKKVECHKKYKYAKDFSKCKILWLN